MAYRTPDRAQEQVTGTTTLVLNGGSPLNWRTLAAAGVVDGDYFPGVVTHRTLAQWKSGIWQRSGSTVVLVTLHASSNADADFTFGAGVKDVAVVALGADAQGEVWPEHFGAVGGADDEADDSVAVAAVLALPGVKVRTKPGSIYRVATSTTVTLPDNADFDLKVLDDVAHGFCLKLKGAGEGTPIALAASSTKGDWALSLSSVSGLAVGQWGKLWTNRWFDAGRTQSRFGELCKLTGITGTNAAVEMPIDDSYRLDRIGQFTVAAAGSSYVVGELLLIPGGTATIASTITNVNTTSGALTLSPRPSTLVVGDIAYVSASGGSLPTGFSASTGYYIRTVSVGSVTILYPTLTDAINQTNPVIPSTSGSGTLTLYVPQALRVIDVDGSGGVSLMEWANHPTYSVLPSGTVSLSGGSGSGAQIALTAEQAWFTPLTMASDVKGKIELTGTSPSAEVSGVQYSYLVYADLEHRVAGVTSSTLSISDCTLCTVRTPKAADSSPGNLGYGVSVDDASQDIYIDAPSAHHVRHAFVCSNSSAKAGVPKRISYRAGALTASSPAGDNASYLYTVTNVDTGTGALTVNPVPGSSLTTGHVCAISSSGALPTGFIAGRPYWVHSSGSAYTLHLTYADSLTAANPVVPADTGSGTITITSQPGGDIIKTHAATGSVIIDVESIHATTGTGVTLESPSAVIRIGKLTNPQSRGVSIANYTSRIGRYSVWIGDLSEPVQEGIAYVNGNSPVESISISGNIRRAGYAGVYIEGAAWRPVLKLVLDNLSLSNCNLTHGPGPIWALNTNRLRMTGIDYEAFNASDVGMTLQDCTDFNINGVNAWHPFLSTGAAISLIGTVAGGTLKGLINGVSVVCSSGASLTGVIVDNNSQNVQITAANDFRQCGTTVSLGSGAGNQYGGVVGFSETVVAAPILTHVVTIDLTKGTVFSTTINANITTFTITGAQLGRAAKFRHILTGNGSGFTQAWGASVKWATPPGAPTVTTTNGKKDIIDYETDDGVTWYASVKGQNYS